MKFIYALLLASVVANKEKELFTKEQGLGLQIDSHGVHTIKEGDIIWDDREEKAKKAMKAHPELSFDVSKTGKWEGGIVPYVFTDANTDARKAVAAAIADFHAKTCVRFVPRTNQRDYISIMNGGGCYSYIGRVGGKQDLSLGRGCEYKSTAIHEFMHALGFWHEQSRLDRDQYVTINLQNIMPGFQSQFEKYQSHQASTLGVSYDKQSVMHYSRTAFGNGKVTIQSKSNPNEVLGNNVGMTATDIKQINRQYGCSTGGDGGEGGGSVTTTTTTPSPATTLPPAEEDSQEFCHLLTDYCVENTWVKSNCKKTCGCVKLRNNRRDSSCNYWAGVRNYCAEGRYINWMKKNCAKACCIEGH